MRARRRGVTILECVLALAILVLAMTALGQLVDFGTARAIDAQVQARGSRLAQSKMAEVEAGAVPVEAGSGDFGADEPGWTWEVGVESASPGAVPLSLVTVTVRRTFGGQTFEVALSQHVLDPAAVASAAPSEVAQPAPAATTDPTTGGMP